MRIENETSNTPLSPGQLVSNGSSNGVSPVQNSKIANGHAANGAGNRAESNGSYANGHEVKDNEVWQGHSKKEVTRILIQGLSDLGYPAAAKQLARESGLELERPNVAAFRDAVLDGNWARAELLLFGDQDEGDGNGTGTSQDQDGMTPLHDRTRKHTNGVWSDPAPRTGLPLSGNASKSQMQFWMRQQKYLELLERRDLGGALNTLRLELTPLNFDQSRLHQLSSLMMCQTAEDVQMQADWDGAAGESRALLLSELSRCISPVVMLPEHRLASLLGQVKDGWIQNCLYHNTAESPSLFVDHVCSRNDFPLKKLIELREHKDEVWFLAFSPDGSMLATAGKDKAIFIYSVPEFKVLYTWRNNHNAGVCYLAWSPDGKRLISCAKEQDNRAIVWDVKTGSILKSLDDFMYAVTAAAWNPRHDSFVIGSQDAGTPLVFYDSNTYEKSYVWREDTQRVNDVAISADGSRLVALLKSRILVFDPVSRSKIADYSMPGVCLTSVDISKDSRHMVVGMHENRIKLLAIDTGEELQTFVGHQQERFIIRSAFGGADETFVVSGSEDSKVYIWRTNGQLVEDLEAHRPDCVNMVAWHPTEPAMFASAGDDAVVRIWTKMQYATDAPIPAMPTSSNGFSR